MLLQIKTIEINCREIFALNYKKWLTSTNQFLNGFVYYVLYLDVMKFVMITELFDDKRLTRSWWTQYTCS